MLGSVLGLEEAQKEAREQGGEEAQALQRRRQDERVTLGLQAEWGDVAQPGTCDSTHHASTVLCLEQSARRCD